MVGEVIWGFLFSFNFLIYFWVPFLLGEKGCGSWVTNLDCHSLLGKIRVFVFYYYYYFGVLVKGFSSLFTILFVVVVVVVVVMVVSWQVMGWCWYYPSTLVAFFFSQKC